MLPVYSGSTIDDYVYSDSTGAQYRLDQNTNNVWTSREGIYVSYDTTANRLCFPNETVIYPARLRQMRHPLPDSYRRQ